MVLVSKQEFNAMKEMGIVKNNGLDKNYTIVNAKKKSHRRKYYVAETYRVLSFLKHYREKMEK